MVELVLASTLHEPENRLGDIIIKFGGFITEIFESAHVMLSPATHSDISNALEDFEFNVSRGPKTIDGIYKSAIKNALEEDPKKIFYCDFDRALHWAKVNNQELREVSDLSDGHDFLLPGRTPRAFGTHPDTQTMTEGVVNRIASKILGFQETRDVLSACWRFTPRIAEKLLQVSTCNTYGFYCKWPIVAWREAQNPGYVEVEGLEWETPDRYRREIREKGYDTWLEEFMTLDEWRRRITIQNEIVEAIIPGTT